MQGKPWGAVASVVVLATQFACGAHVDVAPEAGGAGMTGEGGVDATGGAPANGGRAPDGGMAATGGMPGVGGAGGGQVGCTRPTDCPGSNACSTPTCVDGRCGVEYAPRGTLIEEHVPADCKALVCDGNGNPTDAVDTSNTPLPAGPCFASACAPDGTPTTSALPAGTPCSTSNGGHVCDGAGDCVAASCSDGVQDGSETDVDCGGAACSPCDEPMHCLVDQDCLTDACDPVKLICLALFCFDGIHDGPESGVDCGGFACPFCPPGQGCSTNSDCEYAACSALNGTCGGPECIDQMKDGDETDVDCGGSCGSCTSGKTCNGTWDCEAGHVCFSGQHVCS